MYDETYRPNKILNKVIVVAKELGFSDEEIREQGQGNRLSFWKDDTKQIEFKANIDFPSILIKSTKEDVASFKNKMNVLLIGYAYNIKEYNETMAIYEFDLTKSKEKN